MLACTGYPNFDGIEIFDVLLCNFVDELGEERKIPAVGKQGILEDFVKNCSVDEWSGSFTCGLYTVLQNCTAHAAIRIGNNSSRHQLVRVENEQVLCVVDNTVSFE